MYAEGTENNRKSTVFIWTEKGFILYNALQIQKYINSLIKKPGGLLSVLFSGDTEEKSDNILGFRKWIIYVNLMTGED